jgi:predicted CoA-binding protein
MTDDFQQYLVEDDARIGEIVRSARRIAVLGCKTDAQANQPAYYVPKYLVEAGLDVIPVPVYYPEATTILGRPVYRRLTDVPAPIDIIDVFRRASDITAHLPDLLAAKPRCVWFQLGIRNPTVAADLARAGISVIQDRCLLVEHKKWGTGP